MPINSFLYPAKNVPTGYDVDNSLRFNDGSSDDLTRTPSSAGNRDKWTWSGWIKRSTLSTNQKIFSCGNSSSTFMAIQFNANDTLGFGDSSGGSTVSNIFTDQVFRDPSSWYHIVAHYDSGNSTSTDRLRLYVNGSRVTDLNNTTFPSQNTDGLVNSTTVHNIGQRGDDNHYFDGYMAEVCFILDPDQFGEFDSDSPQIWKPKSVSGLTFGTNGFYLEFKQSGTSQNSSGLGADTSGNDHHFAVANLTSVDQSTDTCTNNFATFNSLSKNDNGTVTFSEGNLQTAHSGSDSRFNSYSTIGVSSGKWYAEVKYEAKSSNSQNDLIVGVAYDVEDLNRQGSGIGGSSGSFSYVGDNGTKLHDGSESSYGSTFTTGDIIGIFLDLDNHKLYFSKNGSVVASGDPTSGSSGTNAAFSLDTGQTYFICAGHGTSSSRETTYSINFGSPIGSISSGNADSEGFGNFEYDPQGYFALNTKNLAEYG
jgi:hypothetical protein